MKNTVHKKIQSLQKALASQNKSVKQLFYITSIAGAPEHIKYRYYVHFSAEIHTFGLECVTKIDEEYVNFKDIFKVKSDNLTNVHPQILDHIELFIDLAILQPESVIVE